MRTHLIVVGFGAYMRFKRRLLAVAIPLIVALLAVASVNILRHRISLLDSFPEGSEWTCTGFAEWKTGDRHILRGRLSRLCLWPPGEFTVTATVVGKDGKQPESTFFAQHGGTNISVVMVHTHTLGLWHYYLPAGWPECVCLVPWHPRSLPEGMRHQEPNRNRYLETANGTWVELRVGGWGIHI